MGVEDVDLVVPAPTPEQRVSDHSLKGKQKVSRVPEREPSKTTLLTQDSSSTMKLVAGVFCISPTVLQPYPPK